MINNKHELNAAMRNAFNFNYSNLTNLIQGGVFAFLVDKISNIYNDSSGLINQNVTNNNFWFSEHIELWIQILVCFLVIVGSWQEYMMGITIFNWIPKIEDALIPFLLGGSEFFLVQTLGEQESVESPIVLSIYFLLGFFAMENMYRKAQSSGVNQFVLSIIKKFRWINSFGCLLLSIFYLLLYFLINYFKNLNYLLFCILILFSIIGMVYRGIIYWKELEDAST
jgi:hypothetical protein